MKKQSQRRIPYRVYKKVFPDCEAWDYSDGKIMVEFPNEYLNDKVIVPDTWEICGNTVCSKMDDNLIYISIEWHQDGGIRYYDAYVCRGNQFHSQASHKSKLYICSFQSALAWAQQARENYFICA